MSDAQSAQSKKWLFQLPAYEVLNWM